MGEVDLAESLAGEFDFKDVEDLFGQSGAVVGDALIEELRPAPRDEDVERAGTLVRSAPPEQDALEEVWITRAQGQAPRADSLGVKIEDRGERGDFN